MTGNDRERPARDPASTRVAHLRSPPAGAGQRLVRIDRRTRWGNRFRIGRDGTREEVIERYRLELRERVSRGTVSLDDLAALKGAVLLCWCSPLACHGDVLARAAEWAFAERERRRTGAGARQHPGSGLGDKR